MRRAIVLPAFCLLCSASALAQAPDRIEMDVLEMDEAPAQAVRRMDEAQRALKARRRTPAEHPGAGTYVPEALGDRGLLVPVGAGDFDRHDRLGNDGGGKHDKDRGEGHDRDHDKGHDKDKGNGKDHGKGPGGG